MMSKFIRRSAATTFSICVISAGVQGVEIENSIFRGVSNSNTEKSVLKTDNSSNTKKTEFDFQFQTTTIGDEIKNLDFVVTNEMGVVHDPETLARAKAAAVF